MKFLDTQNELTSLPANTDQLTIVYWGVGRENSSKLGKQDDL